VDKNGEEVIPASVKLAYYDYNTWLKNTLDLEKRETCPANLVPAYTYFMFMGNNKIIGAINIRHYLNDYLFNYGGHISYGIRPSERRKGYGSLMLAKAIPIAKELGINRILISCDKTNIASDFYSWTIPKENFLILGAALSPNDKAHQKFELLKQKMINNGFKLNKSIRRNGAYLLRPNSKEQICIGDGKIALVGEAAGFISPSSAEGLSYAFRSSLALAKALENGIDGYQIKYHNNLKSLFNNIFLKNIKSHAMYNRFLRKLIMNTGLLSIKIEN